MITRTLTSALFDLKDKYPVLALTGPRQSGKTTLLKSLFNDYRYVSLENPDIRAFAETDPNGFLKKYDSKVIIDEAQRVPMLFSYIQTMVDASGQMGQYILSGSQNFHLMRNITQSLAGRVALFRLFPFDFEELQSANLLPSDYLECLVRGFYPALYDRNIASRVYYANYIQTYLLRDVSELISVKDTRLFQNFLGLCAARAGQLLNINALAKDCAISQPTAKAWLSALEASYIVFLLQPFHENFSKRIIKTPKLYFYDSGLLCYLLRLHETEQIMAHPIKGSLFENMMIAEYVKRMHHHNYAKDIWFWRDAAGHEIDLIIQEGQQLNLNEFKATQTIMPDLFKGLTYFDQNIRAGTNIKSLVYTGDDNHKRTDVEVLSWQNFGR